jgi:pyocin large subunit-like protein
VSVALDERRHLRRGGGNAHETRNASAGLAMDSVGARTPAFHSWDFERAGEAAPRDPRIRCSEQPATEEEENTSTIRKTKPTGKHK